MQYLIISTHNVDLQKNEDLYTSMHKGVFISLLRVHIRLF